MAQSSTLKKLRGLRWTSPSKKLPHGLSGMFSVVLGLLLIIHSILGDLSLYDNNFPIILISYVLSTACNAVAGFRISHLAWKETQSVFRQCALLQLCLVFCVIRFSPMVQTISNAIPNNLLQCLDIVLAVMIVYCTLSFQEVAVEQWTKFHQKSIAIAISFGSFGLLLLSTYPVHLAFGGYEWWDCVQERYPLQGVGMIGYIYVPATTTFGLMLFAATLYQRGILTDIQFGLGSLCITMICLVSTVLSQELHIPFVSTQRIYLPCVEPPEDTFEAKILHALDFSVLSRVIWRQVFGVNIVNE